jgi:RNA polymerase sigma-70 factor (ECF subfamily)
MQPERLYNQTSLNNLPESDKMGMQFSLSEQSAQAWSFDRLFTEFQPLVYSVGLRVLGTHEDAEDVAQEVFTKVWKSYESFNHSSSLKTWIYRIAVNTCIDHRRKPWKKIDLQATVIEGLDDRDSTEASLVSEATAERNLLEKEKAATLSKAIGKLRPHLKDVFILKELEEKSYDEISSILGLSMGTISSRLNRARKALQESLQVLSGDPGLAAATA